MCARNYSVLSPLSAGGPEDFEAFFKRVGLAPCYFLGGEGGGAEPQGGMVFSRGDEDFQLKSLNQ